MGDFFARFQGNPGTGPGFGTYPGLQQLIQTPFNQDTLAALLPYVLEYTSQKEVHPAIAASANLDEHKVNINPEGALWGKGGSDRKTRDILAHEVGHFLQQEPEGQALFNNIIDEWKTVEHKGPYGTTSEYVRTSPEEYFAELVTSAFHVLQEEPQWHEKLAEVIEPERPGTTQMVNYLKKKLQRKE